VHLCEFVIWVSIRLNADRLDASAEGDMGGEIDCNEEVDVIELIGGGMWDECSKTESDLL
jgi:hypothetical protein